MDYTAKVSIEILQYITKFLNPDEVFTCMSVCRRWRLFINSDSIWKPVALKLRIHDPAKESSGGPLELCPWAEAFYQCYRIPSGNWLKDKHTKLRIVKEDCIHLKDAWDGHLMAIYYYTLGRVHLHSIYRSVRLEQVVHVPLPRDETCTCNVMRENAFVALNMPYMVVSRFNVALIYKKGKKVFSLFKTVSITDTVVFDNQLKKRNIKLKGEIGWDAVWFTAVSLKDAFRVDLKTLSVKSIKAPSHFAFNDNVHLVLAWSKWCVRVLTDKGDEKYIIERDKIRAVDYNSKHLILRVVNNIEIFDITNGNSLKVIFCKEKVEFLLSETLFIVEGDRKSCLSNLSVDVEGRCLWSVSDLKGRAESVWVVGLKHLLVVPAFSKSSYCLFDRQGRFIREGHLPPDYNLSLTPFFFDLVSYWVIGGEDHFTILSFM